MNRGISVQGSDTTMLGSELLLVQKKAMLIRKLVNTFKRINGYTD